MQRTRGRVLSAFNITYITCKVMVHVKHEQTITSYRMEASNLPTNRIPPFGKCFRRGLYGSRFLQRSNDVNVCNLLHLCITIQIEQLTTVKIFHRYMDNTCERAIEVRIQV